MFSSISWSQYVTTIVVVLAGYYLYVGYKYFRWELLAFIGISKVEDNSFFISAIEPTKTFKTEKHEDYFPQSNSEVDISPLVQAFTDEVQAYINEASTNSPKPEVMYSLQQIAAKYMALKEADCKTELQEFVYKVVNNKFPELMEKEDTELLWG
jgi:hypothetical protein